MRVGRACALLGVAWLAPLAVADKPADKKDKQAPRPPLSGSLALGRIAYEDEHGAIKVYDVAADKFEDYGLPEKMENVAWASDGARFVYNSGFGVSLLDTKAQNFTSITPVGQEAVEPSFSPDGTRVVYEVRAAGAGLHFYDTRDKKHRRLALSLKAAQPAWHPKEERLAFVSNVDGVDQVFLLDLACEKDESCDKAAVALTKDPKSSRQPAWSPDGAWIAFEREDGKGSGILVVKADGTGLRRLSPNGSKDRRPSWGAVDAIAFEREGDTPWICVMKADGKGAAKLIENGHSPNWWQPRQ
jgi:dipeptidyl aminopeptidase/acylaminoacyl peptidase